MDLILTRAKFKVVDLDEMHRDIQKFVIGELGRAELHGWLIEAQRQIHRLSHSSDFPKQLNSRQNQLIIPAQTGKSHESVLVMVPEENSRVMGSNWQ